MLGPQVALHAAKQHAEDPSTGLRPPLVLHVNQTASQRATRPTACLLAPREVTYLDEIMVPRGLEPRTLRLLAVRSNQLSYETPGQLRFA